MSTHNICFGEKCEKYYVDISSYLELWWDKIFFIMVNLFEMIV